MNYKDNLPIREKIKHRPKSKNFKKKDKLKLNKKNTYKHKEEKALIEAENWNKLINENKRY